MDISKSVTGIIVGVVAIVVLIAVCVGLYPTFTSGLQSANTSGMQFGSVILTIGGILFGVVLLIAIIYALMSMIKKN
jgi:hypothetical protein